MAFGFGARGGAAAFDLLRQRAGVNMGERQCEECGRVIDVKRDGGHRLCRHCREKGWRRLVEIRGKRPGEL